MNYSIKELLTDKISGEWGEETLDGNGTKIIRTTNFTNIGKLDLEDIVIRKIDAKKLEAKHLKYGDIIIEKSGGGPNQPVGRVVFFDLQTSEKYLCNNFTAILRPNKKLVSPQFLFYQLHMAHVRGKTLKYQNKTTGILNLKLDKYLEETIKVPSIPEQIKIADVLGKAETLKEQRKQSITLLDEFLKSTFLKMFGNPVKNEKGWEKVPLKDFGDIITGNTPSRSDLTNFSEKHIEWIKTDNIKTDSLLVSTADEYLSQIGLKKSRFVTKGALLVACIAGSIESIGRANLTDRSVAFNQQINAIQPGKKVNSYFLYHLFKNTKPYVQNHATKGMKRILTKGIFEKILMIRPDIELQNHFAEIVEKTEGLKLQFQYSLTELENLYGSLSQRAFKGELDLSKLHVMHELEYEAGDNDRTEPKHIDLQKVTVELKKTKEPEDTRYGDPFDVDEATAKQMGKEFYKAWEKTDRGIEHKNLEDIIKYATGRKKIKTGPFADAFLKDPDNENFEELEEDFEEAGPSASEAEKTTIVFEQAGLEAISELTGFSANAFNFQEFTALLKKKHELDGYEECRNFIFRQLQNGTLVQTFTPKQWAISTQNSNFNPPGGFHTETASIWFIAVRNTTEE